MLKINYFAQYNWLKVQRSETFFIQIVLEFLISGFCKDTIRIYIYVILIFNTYYLLLVYVNGQLIQTSFDLLV